MSDETLSPIPPLAAVAPPAATPAAAPSRVVVVESLAQFEELAKNAPGQVIVNFTAKDCGYCDDAKPAIEALAAKCPTATVLTIDVDKVPEVAEGKFDVFDSYGGTPTCLMAESGAKLLAGKVREVDPSSVQLLKKLKCSK